MVEAGGGVVEVAEVDEANEIIFELGGTAFLCVIG